MRRLPAVLLFVACWSLACANSKRTPHEGRWSGTCDFPSGAFTLDIEVSDQEGFCDLCEGDMPVLQGYTDITRETGDTETVFAFWYHCVDPAGCVDSDGVEHPTDYVLWRADLRQGYPFDLWLEGRVDPDDDKRIVGDCGLVESVGNRAGPGELSWEGKL